jgi:hypothetical protein
MIYPSTSREIGASNAVHGISVDCRAEVPRLNRRTLAGDTFQGDSLERQMLTSEPSCFNFLMTNRGLRRAPVRFAKPSASCPSSLVLFAPPEPVSVSQGTPRKSSPGFGVISIATKLARSRGRPNQIPALCSRVAPARCSGCQMHGRKVATSSVAPVPLTMNLQAPVARAAKRLAPLARTMRL